MSNSSAARRNNNGRRQRRSGNNSRQTVTPQAREQLQITMMGCRPTLVQPAIRTMIAKLSMNVAPLQQSSGFTHIEFGYEFANMNGSADYVALFDSYRILQIEAVIRPTYTQGVAANVVNFSAPTVYTVLDYEDSNALTTSSQFREYSNCTETQYETVRRRWTPAISTVAYVSGGAATGYTNVFCPWVSIGSPNVEHFGLKVGMEGGSGVVPQVLEINTDFLVEFRCTR